MMIRKHRKQPQRKSKASLSDPRILTLSGHLQELRQRLFYVVSFVVVFTGIGFVIREQLTEWMLRPADAQQFIYTSPVGGFDFIFRISLYFGLALAVPVLMYNLFQYLAPLLPSRTSSFVFKATFTSYLLAIAGVAFGYFASLPAAMNFLLHQFTTEQIQALLSIQEYMSFVMIYLVGFALLFQIPIIMLFINKIKPFQPSQLMGYQRYVIVGATILAAILTPTADIMNMMIMAVPIVIMYQFGVVLVLVSNRRKRRLVKHEADATEVIKPVAVEPERPAVVPRPAYAVPVQPIAQPAPSQPIVLRPMPLNSPNIIQ